MAGSAVGILHHCLREEADSVEVRTAHGVVEPDVQRANLAGCVACHLKGDLIFKLEMAAREQNRGALGA